MATSAGPARAGPQGAPGRQVGTGRRPGPALRRGLRPGGQFRSARALPARRTARAVRRRVPRAAARRAFRFPDRCAATRHLKLVLGTARVRPGHAGPQCRVASPVRHVLPHLPAARGPQRPDSIRIHHDDPPLDGSRPTPGRQPAVPACPRAQSRHALTAAYAAGLPLIAVSVLPRRTAGQDPSIMRSDTGDCAAAEHSDPAARIIRYAPSSMNPKRNSRPRGSADVAHAASHPSR